MWLSLRSFAFYSAIFVFISSSTFIVAQDSEESWTIVVYQDRPYVPSDGYQMTSRIEDWVRPDLDRILEDTVRQQLMKGLDKGETVDVKVVELPIPVSLQVYAGLAHSLQLLDAPLSDVSSREEINTRQKWSFVVRSPPPESIEFVERSFKVNTSNSSTTVISTASPTIKTHQGRPRIHTDWLIEVPHAPVNSLECAGPLHAKINCADGLTIDQEVTVSACFNDRCLARLRPRHMTLSFADPKTYAKLRTKLLTAFSGNTQGVKTGNAEEPTLFVPLSEVIGGRTGGIVAFPVDKLSAPFFFTFASENALTIAASADGDDQLPLVTDQKWIRCQKSDWESYNRLKDPNQSDEGATAESVYQAAIVNNSDPKTHVVVLGPKGGSLTIRIWEFTNGVRGQIGHDISSKLDPDWLQQCFDQAQSQNP